MVGLAERVHCELPVAGRVVLVGGEALEIFKTPGRELLVKPRTQQPVKVDHTFGVRVDEEQSMAFLSWQLAQSETLFVNIAKVLCFRQADQCPLGVVSP